MHSKYECGDLGVTCRHEDDNGLSLRVSDIRMIVRYCKRVFEKIHPDDRRKVKTAVQTAIETGDAASIELRPVLEVEAEWIES